VDFPKGKIIFTKYHVKIWRDLKHLHYEAPELFQGWSGELMFNETSRGYS